MSIRFSFLCVLFLLCLTNLASPLNILFIPIPIGASIVKSDIPYAQELARRGHNVTMFTSAPQSLYVEAELITQHDKPVVKNDVGTAVLVTEEGVEMSFWQFGTDTPWMYYMIISNDMAPSAVLTLQQHREFLRDLVNQDWDLVVLDPTYQYYGFVLSDLIGTPRVNFISTYYETDHKRAMRLPNCEPFVNVAWFRLDSFWSRFESFFLWQVADVFVEYALDWEINSKLRDYFPMGIKRIEEYERSNIWMSLRANNFDWPAPQSHDSLLVGGLNCLDHLSTVVNQPIKDAALNKFLSQPNKKGIVIASFGHYLSWKSAPSFLIEAFKESFRRFPDVLFVWQYNGPAFDPPIANVHASAWIPQKQLLAHPKALLFISHMGLKSIQEGTCFGLPFLSMPVFLDQHVNSHILTEKWKAGLLINRFTLTTEIMSAALGEILSNSKYAEASRKMAKIQQDVVREPTQVAAFWIEYALRHDAVMKPYFSSKGKNLNFFAFYLLDLIGFALMLFGFSIYCIVKLVKKACHHKH